MNKIESLGISTGKIVYSNDRQNILSLSVAEIEALFKSSGILLFRGFGVTYEQMKAFSEQFSSKFTREGTRHLADSSDGFVGLVDPGMNSVSPHSENGNSPFRPDAIWFCCAVPTAQGGETLFWDGVRVWEELSEELKQLFIARKIKFFNNYPVEIWKHFLGSSTTIADAKRTLEGLDDVDYHINEDQSISLAYICSAVVKTKYGNQDAFVNNILTEHKDPEGLVTFEDGSLIPDAVIDEIEKVMDSLTEEVTWQAGDLVMIDNSKFLHGRRAFNDDQRRIYSLLSYLNF
jgi:hypothetical protein